MPSDHTVSTTRKTIFAAYAESEEELKHIEYLADSLRTFGGRFSQAPVWAYLAESLAASLGSDLSARLKALGVDLKTSGIPGDANWFYYAGKTFAAGDAETEAEGQAEILVWMDEDTIVLKEPSELALNDQVDFAYRPVMHNRSGSLASEPPSPFWSRVYELLNLDPDQLFSMVTPADRQTIRAYFNAGLLAVRPERGILRGWGDAFKKLYRDPTLASMCGEDVTWRIFLHQAALVGPVINRLDRSALHELPDSYNYPIFFKKTYGADEEFDDLTEVVTLRYDIYFKEPAPNWYICLKGPAESIAWLKNHLSKSK